MKTFMTHPDNVEAVRKALEREYPPQPGDEFRFFNINGFQLKASSLIPRERESGRLILPGGRVINKGEPFAIVHRFFEYDEADLDFLLYAGIVKPEMELNFYMLSDEAFRIRHNFGPSIMNPSFILTTPFA